jgi:apolipoprotein D and lipocalin family protein
MMMSQYIPQDGLKKLAKIAFGGILLMGMSGMKLVHAQPKAMVPVDQVKLDQYLGAWYEIARKPLSFQDKCDRDVVAQYTLNENGNIQVDNRCVMKNGQTTRSLGEAFVKNAPQNSKLQVSFLPEVIRWLPFGRGDYWILKIDDDYQTVLVGEPDRKYLWILSRTTQPSQQVIDEYLAYAKSLGYELGDLIHTKHTPR